MPFGMVYETIGSVKYGKQLKTKIDWLRVSYVSLLDAEPTPALQSKGV